MDRYDPQTIEAKWQRVWEDERAFYVPNPSPGGARKKFYMLEMLPYPSGTLHMGHVLNYTLGDVLTHFRRRNGGRPAADGLRLLRPAGGERGDPGGRAPARDHRAQHRAHPRRDAPAGLGGRLGSRGLCARAEYYRWTQWLFLQFFEAGLAYRKEAPVNWCPNDQTVVANEYVIDGKCERCGAEVIAMNMEQWFFRITAYADQLLDRPGADRLAGADEDDPDELDRPLGGRRRPVPSRRARHRHPRLHHPSGHAVRRDVLRARARAPTRRRAGERRGARVRIEGRRAVGRGAPDEGQGRRLHRPARAQSRQRRADSDLDRRLRPDGLRDWARSWPCPRTTSATSSLRAGTTCPSAGDRRGRTNVLIDSGDFTGLPAEEAKQKIVQWLREQGRGAPRSATACATGRSHASATGAARSRSSTATTRHRSRPGGRSCPSCCPRSRTTGRRASRPSPPTRSG